MKPWAIEDLHCQLYFEILSNCISLKTCAILQNFQISLIVLARVVQKVGNAIRRINRYPADSVVCFVNIYPLDSALSGG